MIHKKGEESMEACPKSVIVSSFRQLQKEERFGAYDLGGQRTIGAFPSMRKAKQFINQNVGFVHESEYPFVLLEEVTIECYPRLVKQRLLEIKITTANGNQKQTPVFESRPLPEDFHQQCVALS